VRKYPRLHNVLPTLYSFNELPHDLQRLIIHAVTKGRP
jgi:hypothetical protein